MSDGAPGNAARFSDQQVRNGLGVSILASSLGVLHYGLLVPGTGGIEGSRRANGRPRLRDETSAAKSANTPTEELGNIRFAGFTHLAGRPVVPAPNGISLLSQGLFRSARIAGSTRLGRRTE
jgi:hypothetical protein